MNTELREEDMHYHGGLMDGDGSLGIKDHEDGGCVFGHWFAPVVQIGQQDFSFDWHDSDVLYDKNYDFHYLAGLFDSDGHFGIFNAEVDGFLFGHQILPTVQIKMKQEEYKNPTKELVGELYDEYAPNCNFRVRYADEDRSNMWVISTSGNPALDMMRELKPYLRLKKPKVEEILSVDWNRVSKDEYEFMYAAVIQEKITKDNSYEKKRNVEYFANHLGVPMDDVEEMRSEIFDSDSDREKQEVVDSVRPTEPAHKVSW